MDYASKDVHQHNRTFDHGGLVKALCEWGGCRSTPGKQPTAHLKRGGRQVNFPESKEEEGASYYLWPRSDDCVSRHHLSLSAV